jgi:hypothetical protein
MKQFDTFIKSILQEWVLPSGEMKTLKQLRETSGSLYTRTVTGENTVEHWNKELPAFIEKMYEERGIRVTEEENGVRIHDGFNRFVRKPLFDENPIDLEVYFDRDGTFKTVIDDKIFHGPKITRGDLTGDGFSVRGNGNTLVYKLKNLEPKPEPVKKGEWWE